MTEHTPTIIIGSYDWPFYVNQPGAGAQRARMRIERQRAIWADRMPPSAKLSRQMRRAAARKEARK